jgi:hypothetical protein
MSTILRIASDLVLRRAFLRLPARFLSTLISRESHTDFFLAFQLQKVKTDMLDNVISLNGRSFVSCCCWSICLYRFKVGFETTWHENLVIGAQTPLAYASLGSCSFYTTRYPRALFDTAARGGHGERPYTQYVSLLILYIHCDPISTCLFSATSIF